MYKDVGIIAGVLRNLTKTYICWVVKMSAPAQQFLDLFMFYDFGPLIFRISADTYAYVRLCTHPCAWIYISAGWKVKMKWWRCRVFFLVGHVTLLIPQDAARSIQPGTARAEGCTKSTMYYGLYFLVMSRITLCTRDGLLMAVNSSGWECNMIWGKMYTYGVEFLVKRCVGWISEM